MKTTVEPQNRLRLLLNHKNRKMAASAHAYMRGSTRRFYEWLQQTDRVELPNGPPIWICGDCHVGNLGPIGNGNGKLAVQIRDLDQTVIGNPAHDLVRLGLSLAMAARSSALPGVITALMIEKMVEGYTSAFEPGAASEHSDIDVPDVVRHTMHAASRRSWKHLRTNGSRGKLSFPLGPDFGLCLKKKQLK